MSDISLPPRIRAAGLLGLRLGALVAGLGTCAAFWLWIARVLLA